MAGRFTVGLPRRRTTVSSRILELLLILLAAAQSLFLILRTASVYFSLHGHRGLCDVGLRHRYFLSLSRSLPFFYSFYFLHIIFSIVLNPLTRSSFINSSSLQVHRRIVQVLNFRIPFTIFFLLQINESIISLLPTDLQKSFDFIILFLYLHCYQTEIKTDQFYFYLGDSPEFRLFTYFLLFFFPFFSICIILSLRNWVSTKGLILFFTFLFVCLS